MKTRPEAVNLDDFRWNLAAVASLVRVIQIAVESAGTDIPQEDLWRALAVAAELSDQNLAEFDSEAFEAAWRKRPAGRPITLDGSKSDNPGEARP